MSIAPIRRFIDVRSAAAPAFEMFTRHWPLEAEAHDDRRVAVHRHRSGASRRRPLVRARAGWRRDQPGRDAGLGASARLLLAWRINANWAYDPELLTVVELSFTPRGQGTRVMLEHRNMERFGDSAERVANLLRDGWPAPPQEYADYVNRSDIGEESAPHD